MRDVSEVHERLFREGDSDTKFGAFRTKFWRETEMAGIAKSTIANVHVEALRRGAFLSGQTRIDESHIPDTWLTDQKHFSVFIV
jgi:hypothetical protein